MSYVNWFKRVFTGTGSDNTAEGSIIRTGGKHVIKTITLSANNTSASVNVFQLTGVCSVMALHAEITSATTLNNCTSVYFDLWDGTTSTAITKTTGAAISGFGVGSFLIKDSNNASSITTIQNNQARIVEAGSGQHVELGFVVIQKVSTNTYIRFNYTTTDAPINAQIQVHITYKDIDSGTIVAV